MTLEQGRSLLLCCLSFFAFLASLDYKLPKVFIWYQPDKSQCSQEPPDNRKAETINLINHYPPTVHQWDTRFQSNFQKLLSFKIQILMKEERIEDSLFFCVPPANPITFQTRWRRAAFQYPCWQTQLQYPSAFQLASPCRAVAGSCSASYYDDALLLHTGSSNENEETHVSFHHLQTDFLPLTDRPSPFPQAHTRTSFPTAFPTPILTLCYFGVRSQN